MTAMRLRQVPGCTQRELSSGENVVLAADGQSAVVLNPMAAVIFALCAAPCDEAALVAELCGRFKDVPAERIAADVHRLLEELLRARLLEGA